MKKIVPKQSTAKALGGNVVNLATLSAESPKIVTQLEEITPPIAKEYLLRNKKNRPVKEKTVLIYADDMRAGNWRVTHQGIAFNENGDLMDGQHRLLAVIESGCTVIMNVTRGLPAELEEQRKTMDAIDQGVVRSIADQLRLQHEMSYRVNLIVAIANRIVYLVFGQIRKAQKLSTSKTVEILKLYNEHIEAVLKPLEKTTIPQLRKAPIMAALAFCRAAYADEVDHFLVDYSAESGNSANAAGLLHGKMKSDLYYGGSQSDRIKMSEEAMAAVRAFINGNTGINPAPDDLQFFAKHQLENIDRLQKIFFEKARERGGSNPVPQKVTKPAARAPLPPVDRGPGAAPAGQIRQPAFSIPEPAPKFEDPEKIELPEDISADQAFEEYLDGVSNLKFSKAYRAALEARYMKLRKKEAQAA